MVFHTRDINKAVLNNPDKFPENYVIKLSKSEKQELVENFHRFEPLKHSTAIPKAFPERGLHMLATILKSAKATQATFAIIEHRQTGVCGVACRRQPIGETSGRERGKLLPRAGNSPPRSRSSLSSRTKESKNPSCSEAVKSLRISLTRDCKPAIPTTGATALRGGACLW